MKIQRRFSKPGIDPLDEVRWERRESVIREPDGTVVFEMRDIEVPADWSQVATDILAQKYFRKAGVPQPDGTLGCETSARQVVRRLAGCWTDWGRRYKYFDTDEDAAAFDAELTHMLINQMASPNSPQWFNTGLAYAYGIKGQPQGHYYVDSDTKELLRSPDAYSRVQGHACYIQSISDDLVNDGGIMDLWVREARLFKLGSGTGTNFSNIRGEGEPLAGGGTSSGLMSFLRVGDRAAGAIKSGGTTRRAAKMVVLDLDHPDIEQFIDWKVEEEKKVAALIAAGYDGSYEGSAYQTVSGQNSNNSVRVPNKFVDAVRNDGTWDLTWRTNGKVCKTVRARELWDRIARAAWSCADPGVQFDDIINDWHTTPQSGRIRASNPCSEYLHLDDSACNLASINLMKFYDAANNTFDVEGYKHAIRLWTIVLEITVLMAHFPSKEIARKAYDFRQLGLGYANLGTLLMVSGTPYDSARALAFAGAVSAILTGEAYATSAELARDLGTFSGYRENAEHMMCVIRNHRRAAYNARASEYEQLSVVPMGIDPSMCPPYMLAAARECWDRALELGEEYGYRNAQATCIAPTGTIGLQMGCDTTGIEPDFALVKFKKLAGGGYFKIINESLPLALRHLGYTEEQIDDIIRYAKGSGSLYGAPYINAETLRARGFTNEDIIKIEKALPTVFDIGFAFNQWTLGPDALERVGITKEQASVQDFDLLRALGFSREEIESANNYICGTMTIEGAPHLKEEHYAVFDCANKCGKLGKRFIHHMGHVRMMAAAQPFMSGGISKTVNLPNEATVGDIEETYMRSWELGVKCIALYRDGSKLSQPLSNKGTDKVSSEGDNGRQLALSEEFAKQLEAARKQRAEELRPDEILAAAQRILANATNTDFKRKVAQALERNRLPAKRRGWTQKAKIAGHTVFLRTGEYADGTLGEIFVDLHKEGASFRSLMNCFAIAVSIGLQYGVPLDEFVDKFVFTRFEPNGFVDHPNIKHCTSVVDYIFRVLGMEYLGRTDFVQVKPEDKDVDETHNDDHAHAEFEARVSAQQAEDDARPSRGQAQPQATARASAPASTNRPAVDPELGAQLSAIRSREAQMASLMGDAPLCDVCGSITRRNGACYVCDSCGRSMGCS
jgi:ribonucleoside-diphosphate reductase alpha chain